MQKTYETSKWKGSYITASHVVRQIEERWGKEEAKNYEPKQNCLTFFGWKQLGYKVKENEHGLNSYVTIKEGNKYIEKHFKLYYYLQVEKI